MKAFNGGLEDTVGSIADGKGLGKGINVLTAKSNTEYSGANALSRDKVYALPAEKTSIYSSDIGSVSSLSVKDLNINAKYNFGADLEVDFKAINAGISGLTGGNASYASYMYKYFYNYHNEYRSYRISIEDYPDSSTFQNCFSDIFLSDIGAISDGNMTAAAFFAKYGTHIIGSAIYGGCMTSTLSVFSNTAKINAGAQNEITKSISALDINTYSTAKIVEQINKEFGFGYSSSELTAVQNIKIVGGKSIPSTENSLSDFANNKKEWCNSLHEEDKYNVIINFATDGLIPIWSLISDTAVSKKLSDSFNTLMKANHENYIKNYRAENKSDYAGGDGSFGNPYQIKTINNLKNVVKNMSACFKLVNNISLNGIQWEPIGGFYGEKAFTGYFDGNNKNIRYLTRSNAINEKDKKIYFGLFSSLKNKAVVSNLNFENTYVSMTGPSGTSGDSRAYVGTVAASAENSKIFNCKLLSGYCKLDVNVNGEVYVGGICGRVIGSEIEQCSNAGEIVAGRYTGIAGGIAGYGRDSEFYSCNNTGSIKSIGTSMWGRSYAGGIVGCGYKKNSSTVKCYNCESNEQLTATEYSSGIWCYKEKGKIIAFEEDRYR